MYFLVHEGNVETILAALLNLFLDSSKYFGNGDRRSVRYQNLRKDTYVYSIDNINRSIDKSLKQENGQDVLYNMLNPEGLFKSGDQYKMKRNKIYVEVSNPVIKESSSAKDLRWSISLLKMTLDAEPNLYNPISGTEVSKMFPDISQRTRFENEAMQLKKIINTSINENQVRSVSGGDHNASRMYLMNIQNLFSQNIIL